MKSSELLTPAEMCREGVLLSQHFLIGMPQLSLGGLSENWLLKECGNQHWLALAKHLGLEKALFLDNKGRQMYAAFLVVKITDGLLSRVAEHDQIIINTQLKRVSSSRSYSSHKMYLENQCIATVELLSSFVRRSEQGNNQTVSRSEVMHGQWESDERANELIAEHKRSRKTNDVDFRSKEEAKCRLFEYRPCPYTDFNGADFLYFAQFQSVIDRAERFQQRGAQLWQISQRTIFYYGNVNIDDALNCVFDLWDMTGKVRKTNTLNHSSLIRRSSDNKVIAYALTQKVEMNHANQFWSQRALPKSQGSDLQYSQEEVL